MTYLPQKEVYLGVCASLASQRRANSPQCGTAAGRWQKSGRRVRYASRQAYTIP
jgi:hypothetical protein